MKLKQFLRDQYNLSMGELKALPQFEQDRIRWEHANELRRLQLVESARKRFLASGGIIRQATPEELERARERSARERRHYENSLKAGGVNEYAYIALHHRWNEE